MSQATQILARSLKPLILPTPDGRPSIVAATTPAIRAARVQAADEGKRFLALGYQQSDEPAAKGGVVMNSNGFRFKRSRLRAIARTFRGNPFITAHDWGDVRARGGTIVDSYAEEVEPSSPSATAIYYEINATADWAIEGLENGTIDRFSLGVTPVGDPLCTAHNVPVWTSGCYCWPGETVVIDDREVVAEWEYPDAQGVELSCVNVAAVLGTRIVEMRDDEEEDEGDEDVEASVQRDLALLCGRDRPRMPTRLRSPALAGGAQEGGLRAEPVPPTMAESTPTPAREPQMDRTALCRRLNLPTTASDAEIDARLDEMNAASTENASALASARAREIELGVQVLSQHVEGELARLTRERQVPAATLAELRATAATAATASGREIPLADRRAAFDRELSLVERHAPKCAPPVGAPVAAQLQSAAPALAKATEVAAGDGIDAYEQHKDNPSLPKLMRACKLTAANIREFGPRSITVVPNLAELAAASERG